MPNGIEFGGDTFDTAERIGLMPMMRFAKVANEGIDSNTLQGLAAMYDLLEQCIAPHDWSRFQKVADRTHADGEELMAVVGKVFEVLSARPTSRPSVSSDGPSTTSTPSTAGSSSPVVARLEREGRPDLALLVSQAQAS